MITPTSDPGSRCDLGPRHCLIFPCGRRRFDYNYPRMIHCQRCLTANPLGHELCRHCGTKLLLMAPAPTDAGLIGHSLEEHLLERISILEYSLIRATERVERIIDLVERLAENTSYDHNFIQSLASLITAKGLVEPEEINLAVKARL